MTFHSHYESSRVDREIAQSYFHTYSNGIRHDPETKTWDVTPQRRREREVSMRRTKQLMKLALSEQEEIDKVDKGKRSSDRED